jgi:hypothetical protein
MGRSGAQVAVLDAGNRVHIRKVTIARDFGSVVQLGEGVTRADRIIDSPPDGIAEGDLVRVSGNQPAAATPARKAG